MNNNRSLLTALLVLLLSSGFLLSSCSTGQDADGVHVGNIQVDDRFEEMNRAVFAFNDAASDFLIHPIVKSYRFVVPKPARSGIRNFLRNLKSPVNFLNQVLQGDLSGAENTFTRAVVNTLLGVGGVFDLAGYEGFEYESEDFGQTLAVWGVGHGPYLVAPVIGPSSLRDFSGYAVDSFADPLRYYLHNIDEEEWYYAKVGMDYLDLRESFIDVLEDLESSSIDYYASVRSTYYQSRESMVKDGKIDSTSTNENAYPAFDDF